MVLSMILTEFLEYFKPQTVKKIVKFCYRFGVITVFFYFNVTFTWVQSMLSFLWVGGEYA